jgi:hypothetical protein
MLSAEADGARRWNGGAVDEERFGSAHCSWRRAMQSSARFSCNVDEKVNVNGMVPGVIDGRKR